MTAEQVIADTQPGEWPCEAINAAPHLWHEISEEHYWYFLEVLPPIYFPGGFAVSEANRADEQGRETYTCVSTVGQRHFARDMAIPDAVRETQILRDVLGFGLVV